MKLHISLFALAAVLSSEAHAQQSDVDPAAQALGASSNKLICETVSPEFPYAHKYISVNGVKLAYVEIGKGDPIILTHGNPTSSYMWRNVIPELAKYGRVIALDAAGHGKSETSSTDYDFSDYIDSLEGFIQKKKLKNVTLVMHDWLPGAAGFEYARRHEDNVKGLAFMESVMGPRFPSSFEDISMPFQNFMRFAKTPEFQESVVEKNAFVENMRTEPCGISDEAFAQYAAPFEVKSRRRVLQAYPITVPVGPDADGEAAQIVQAYSEWLKTSPLPKLLIRAEPGAIMDAESAGEIVKTTPNLSVVTVKTAVHFIPETHPGKVGRELSHWFQEISRKRP